MTEESIIKDKCPVSGLRKITYPNWINKTFGTDNYSVSLFLLGENIILSEINGYNSLESARKRIEFIEDVVCKHLPNQSYFMLEDYTNFTGASKKSKKYYINHQKNNKMLKGVIFFNATIYMKIMLKIGKSIGLAKFPVHIVNNYIDAINLVFQINENKNNLISPTVQKLVVGQDRYKLTTNDEWHLKFDCCEIEFQLVENDIIYSKIGGILKTEYIDKTISLYKKVLHDTNLDKKGFYYRVLNLSDMKKMTMQTRKKYTEEYKKLQSEVTAKETVIYGSNRFMKTIIMLSKPFLKSKYTFTDSLDKALTIIKNTKQNRPQSINNSRKQIEYYSDELLQFLGNIDWDIRGKVSEEVLKEHPFKTVFEAISVVKDDIDYLFEENRKVNLKQKILFETANDAILLLEKGYYIDCNETAVKMFGYDKKEEIIGKTPLDFCPSFQPNGQESKLLAKEHLKTTKKNKKINFEWLHKKKNGEEFFTEVSLNLFEFQDEKNIQTTIRDISVRKKAEKVEQEKLKTEISSKAKSIFLNNSGQGFLSFGKDLLINVEYSRECEKIFEQDIAGKSIASLLYPDDLENRKLIEKNFSCSLLESNSYTQKLYLSLLKKEYQVGGKFVKAEYKMIDKHKMMLILTDITRQKTLENKIYNERNRLKFVVTAIQESHYFFDILNDFEKFITNFSKLIAAKDNSTEILAEIYRSIHTFKGLFAQQDFPQIPAVLHQVEDYLSKKQKSKTIDISKLADLMSKYKCQEVLDRDLAIIEEILGKDFLKHEERRGGITISREQAEKIEAMTQKLLSMDNGLIDQKTRLLLQETEKILHVNLKSLIGFHLNNAIKLADRLGKNISRFIIEGDNIFINTNYYASFIKSLVHVFRNAVDHGIETAEEREELGKKADAELICFVKEITEEDNCKILISISDNGRGLDDSKIRDKAVKLGIFTEEEIGNISKDEIYHLIFNANFSTKSTVTDLSGRGVGLNAVKKELDKLKGKIKIESEFGKGTTFHFIIPINCN